MTYKHVRATAPPEPTPEQLIRAREQRVLPVIPERLSDPELRLIRESPTGPLADSYRTQWYLFEYDTRRYVLTPQLPGTVSDSYELPPTEFPAHFVAAGTGEAHQARSPNALPPRVSCPRGWRN